VDDDEDEDEDDEDEGSAPPPPSKCEELIAKLEESMDAPELAELAAEVKAIETAFKDLQAANVGLEDQTGALKDQYLRLNADFDNFKKRTIKEKEQLATNAKSRVFEAMLPALDNFDLAEANLKTENEGEEKIAKSYQGLVDGLMTILSAQGLSTVAGVGSPFDPNFHEAIMRDESEEHPEDTISEEFRKGYKMGEDQLVRAAMVKVSSGPPASEE
jgi:molecular chaperone GrpE